ncbi:MAG: Wide host range VirA protein [Syntrophorhabdus sp. PtaU1.Bin050]|nr:MAG: Wide host range VirA protein [Syntrophorhabdus sp. PtaU1.Bin050]
MLETGKPHRWEVTTAGGSIIDVYDVPFIDVNGSPLILEMDTDITDRRRAEEDMVRLQAQLRHAQKMEALGTFASGIAHDFNNILAAIAGFAGLLERQLPPRSRETIHAKRILEATRRGRELIGQMLTFTRKTEPETKPLRLSTVIKESVDLLQAAVPATINIKVNVSSESGLILGDPNQVQQVLMNLCTNAVQAMHGKGGTVDIDISDFSVADANTMDGMEAGHYIKLTVRDSGIGIPHEIRDRIFDPFFTTKKLGEGTGLGLSVAHGIVRDAKGHITVESEPGRGSAFTVYFPRIIAEAVSEGEGDTIS